MMEPISKTAQPQDIGSVVAIVGTKGWQCRLCSTTFPRSLSIEYHMMASHPPQAQQGSVLPPPGNTPVPVGLGDPYPNREQDNVMRDVSMSDDPNQTAVDAKDSRGELSCFAGMEGVRSAPAHAHAETGSDVDPAGDSSSYRRDEGTSHIKVEPCVNTPNNPGDAMYQEDLFAHVDKHREQQSVADTAADMDRLRSARPGDTDDHNSVTQGGNSMVPSDENVKAGLSSAQSCPFSPGNHMAGSCSQLRRHETPRTTGSHKPYKQCTCSCGQVFESKHEFKLHHRVAHCQLKHKSFVCHICGTGYQYKRGLNRHLAEKGSDPFPCSNCPQQFHNHISLVEHRKHCLSPEGDRPEPSRSVGQGSGMDQTQSLSLSENEVASHHGTEDSFPWECSRCKKHFREKCTFRKHLKQCGILVVTDRNRQFICNLCGSSFQWMVGYHRHYVLDHKLALLGQSVNTSSGFSPFTGNSPVPSPAPSVTSEINTAMAGVNLNLLETSDVFRESSSPCSSTIDLTSDPGLDDDMQHIQEGVCRLVSSSQTTTVSSDDWSPALTVTSSNPVVTLVTNCVNMPSQSSVPDSQILPQTTVTSSSEYLSQSSTTSSSNPRSLTSDPSSSCPFSLPSTASSWEQSSEVESIVISDEDTRGSDSSSDSEEDWEIISAHSREGKKTEPQAGDWEAAQEEGDYFRHPHHLHPPPPPGPPFPPPPPHPHPRHSFPPPPPMHPHGHHFPPPHHPHFHRPWFARGGGFRGSIMHGCRGWFGAARFGPPNWFRPENSMSDDSQKPEDAGSATSSTTCEAESCGSACSPDSSQHPFNHAANFCKWAGKWKENKQYMKIFKKATFIMLKSCQTGGRFLFCPEPECFQTFMEESELARHHQENHPSSKDYICFICQQSHPEPLSYNRHIRQHCQTVVDMGNLRGRGRGHGLLGMGRKMLKQLWKGGTPYDTFSGQHFGHNHPHAPETDKDASGPEVLASEEFKECPVCKKKYRANSRECFFERHVNSHYGVEVSNFECDVCGKKFLEKAKFTAHQQAKHKSSPFVCQECGCSYQSKTSLKRHERIHTGERPHKCPDCGEGFIELRELERHRTKHTGQVPFQCTVCGKGFTLKDSVLNHLRRQHPEKSPVNCIRRAVPLSEMDPQRKSDKASMPLERQARDATAIKAETQTECERNEPSGMEVD